MSSIIDGYNYDIFISYRQKDNKGERWVSEFVEALKTELESTFKEEISVYFDINPHDGLLETHDVDASLKGKLKCLVFIPIISRTYCDPKSFAWENELKAFVEQASKDQFGLKIKLPNGNVASRVLPVRIYDLDVHDIKLCESVLGGVLRGVDFIYKSPGVNRPLRSREEKPQDNLNNILYRDQINKVANAIKEIFTSLGQFGQQAEDAQREAFKPISFPPESKKTKIIIGLVIALALVLLGYFIIPGLLKPQEKLEKSLAVLPFINDSPDQENTYFINGIMDEILNNLQKIRDFRVLSRTSTEQYRGTNKQSIPKIAKDLGVNYMVEGSGQKYGNKFVLRVQLIAADNEKHLWAKSYDQEINETSDLINIQSQIAQSIAAELNAIITPEEKQLIEKIPTTNLTAYDFYQRGIDELTKYPWPDKPTPEALRRVETLFHKALEYDSTLAQAFVGLAEVFWIKRDRYDITDYNILNNYRDSMLILADIALSYNDKLSEAYIIRGEYYRGKGNSKKTLEELDKAIKYNPNDGRAYRQKARVYDDFDLVKTLENLQRAASLIRGQDLPIILYQLGYTYYNAGFPEIGKDFSIEALKLNGDSVRYLDNLISTIALTQGDYQKAIEHFEKRYLTDSTNTETINLLGYYNTLNGQYKESLKYYKKYISVLESTGLTNPPLDPCIGYAYLQNGYRKEADYYFDRQIESFNSSLTESFDPYWLASIYACRGDKGKAYEYLKIFDQDQSVNLYEVISMKNDPLFNSIRNEQEFQKFARNMEARYQAEHERVRKWLEEQGRL